MAKFKEIKSGLVYEFLSAWDVEQMRKHPEYMEIKEEPLVGTSQVPVASALEEKDKVDGYSVADSKRGFKKAS